jgi:chemotaxis protein CheX
MRMTQTIQPELVHQFLAAVVRALRMTVGIEAVVATVGEVGARPPPTVAVALDMAGDVRGPVTWVFPPAIALELVRRLLDEPDPSPESAADGAAELANILTGRASIALEAAGFRCEMGPPRMHDGELPGGLAARLTTASGPIDVVLSLIPQ